jgi:hypothetical protein
MCIEGCGVRIWCRRIRDCARKNMALSRATTACYSKSTQSAPAFGCDSVNRNPAGRDVEPLQRGRSGRSPRQTVKARFAKARWKRGQLSRDDSGRSDLGRSNSWWSNLYYGREVQASVPWKTNFTILKSLYLTSLHFYFSTALFIFITDP